MKTFEIVGAGEKAAEKTPTPKNQNLLPERQAYSPKEFAALFGRAQTWGYRQLYSGRIKAVQNFGRLLIPRSEVERLLATAAIYNGEGVE